MYRLLVVVILLAIAGLEITFPTTETSAKVNEMLPGVELAPIRASQSEPKETQVGIESIRDPSEFRGGVPGRKPERAEQR